jgi:hypothetical protein
MAHRLFGGAFGLAAGLVRHVAWYVSHQIEGRPRRRD